MHGVSLLAEAGAEGSDLCHPRRRSHALGCFQHNNGVTPAPCCRLGPSQGINLAVDLCNVVSLHSGLPISVVDLERAVAPLRVGLAPAGARYVFNASGQVIDIGGLISLFDAEGPCAGPVKDSQRTKTHAGTVETLVLIWGPQSLASQVEATAAWYASLLREHGATAEPVAQENH